MKHKLLFVLLFVVVLAFVECAPASGRMPACLTEECDMDSGPVCGIDASGLPKTFENRCMAMYAFCRFGSFYVEVKPGEC